MSPIETLRIIEDLKAQRKRVQENIDASANVIATAKARLETAKRQLIDIEGAALRGLSSENAVAAARDAVDGAKTDLESHRHATTRADEVAQQVDSELAQAKREHENALAARAGALIEPIKARIAGDRKLRAALVEIFGLIAANSTQPGVVDWGSILSDCFPWPKDSEAAAAVAAGRKAVLS